MLRRLVDERIKVVIDCQPDLWLVRADPAEMGRALLNLSLNARDAMPGGGTLAVETANVTLTEADASNQELAPGRYVTMTVRDTGIGIDPASMEHLFEPFFSTKETGKGTGLGLATVLGIIEQSGGIVRCESEPGKGTTFSIFLPVVAEAVDNAADPAGGPAALLKGTEVILLVEDEDIVRSLTRRVLERCGYVVYEARNGRQGLSFCEAHDGPIDLLVSDVVMPVLGGRELAEGALKLRPRMKALFVSGHTEDVVLMAGIRKGTPFLEKPFTAGELSRIVREVLDSGT